VVLSDQCACLQITCKDENIPVSKIHWRNIAIALNIFHCKTAAYCQLEFRKEIYYNIKVKVKVKVKQSRYRPGVAQRVPGS
jgi:hypothetical protein